ncbi:MAG: diguanylate cyclase [Halobacteriovoraceae bacterium]|nr:diguanylate cyclase [Halobacteriovoraceae bacterium]|tara:strand:- start:2337 stop:2780 length:444 start_codon:yes stop_codon:yes gene_type:complete
MVKEKHYQLLTKQIKAITEGETNFIANCANITALLHEGFPFLWTGFYFVDDHELILGPFQGPVACTRIPYGKGVCGSAWQEEKTLIVGNVHEFPGHIACSSASNSEIVVPIFKNSKVVAVLDIDSTELDYFDKTDQKYLEQIVSECL